MERLKIGFVPAHREPFDQNWAAKMRERCLKAFSQNKMLEIIVPDTQLTQGGCVRDDHEAEKAIALFRENEIDGLIIGTMTFGDEVSALSVASAFRDRPILLFGTKEGPFTADGNRRSDSFCGTLSISSGLHRRQIPFMFGGIVFPEERDFQDDVGTFSACAPSPADLSGARIGLVGPRPERFETCIFSEDLLMEKFRQRVVPIDLADIMSRAGSPEALPEIRKIVRKNESPGRSFGGRHDHHREDRRAGICSDPICRGKSACPPWASSAGRPCRRFTALSPCYAMGRLTDQGIMTSCEVDIYGALTMLVQYLASLGKTVPHFIDWTIQHQEKQNTFLAWHCGNAPPSLCDGRQSERQLPQHSRRVARHGPFQGHR